MTLDQLAAEYLVTVDGRTVETPCGAWCGPEDIDVWKGVVGRIRRDLVATIKTRTTGGALVIERGLQGRLAQWLARSTRFESKWWAVFGSASNEVADLVTFARAGVQLLFELQAVVAEQGGEAPTPGPRTLDKPDPGLPGNDWLWLLGAAGAVLVLYLLFRD